MKVNISYRVNIEDVLNTVEGLMSTALRTAEKNLNETSAACQNINEDSLQKTINSVKILRENLISLDLQLEDHTSILLGYQNIINAPSPEVISAEDALDAEAAEDA